LANENLAVRIYCLLQPEVSFQDSKYRTISIAFEPVIVVMNAADCFGQIGGKRA
jgi:hypothetical protein